MRLARARPLGLAAWLPILAAATACSGGHHRPATTVPPSSTTSGPVTTLPPTTSSSLAAPASSQLGAGCTLDELQITTPGVQGAAGHQAAVLVFENHGSRTCVLTGYPGVTAVNAAGQRAADAQRTPSGFAGGLASASEAPPVLHLAPGQKGSATVEGSSVPSGGAAGCPTYAELDVTPPGETRSVRIQAGLPGCSPLQVHPVVAGDTGREVH